MCFIVYMASLLIALLAVFPLNGFLTKTVGNSLSIKDTIAGFNFEFTADLLNNFGANLSPILNQSLIVLGFFFVLFVFLTGGILNILKEDRSSFFAPDFWRGCTKYFWRLFRLTCYFLLVQGLLLLLFFNLFKMISGGLSPFLLESENDWTRTFNILSPIYVFFASIVFVVQDYAKIQLVKEDRFIVLGVILRSFGWVFKRFFSCLLIFILTGLTALFFWWLYSFISPKINADSSLAIGLSFLLGQVFLFVRIGMNLLNLGAVNHFDNAFRNKSYNK